MSAQNKTGTLIGVGLGPGDPELITLKTHRLITRARVISYPTLESGASFARSIVADFLPKDITELAISIPMSENRKLAQAAYDDGAARIARHLDAGDDVLALCEGDPFFYGSFMYLFARLKPHYPVQVIAGVSSLNACAAAVPAPLCARNETLTIIPAPLDEDTLKSQIAAAKSFAIVKVGRHLPKVRRVLATLGLEGAATYIERASLPNMRVLQLTELAEPAPYFSMIIVNRGDDPWL